MRNKKFEEYVMKVIKKYQPILDLNNYTFKLNYPCQNDDAAMESCFVYPYMDAVFNYSDIIIERWKKKEDIRGVIIHEMCHLITDPLYSKGENRWTSRNEILDEREKLTDFISKLVLKIKDN